jgi:hypothetical protein
MQDRRGNLRGRPVEGVAQTQRIEHLLPQGDVERLAGDLLQRLPQDHVVGVGVIPVRAGGKDARRLHAERDLLLRHPLPERVRVQHLIHFRALLEVGVAGGHVRQHSERDRVGVGQVGQPLRQRIVERDHSLVDQPEEERRDVEDGDGAVAEVHVGRGRYAGHRLAEGGRDHVLAPDGHAQDDRPDVLPRHHLARDGDDRLSPIGRGSRRRRGLTPRRGGARSNMARGQRAACGGETDRDGFPPRHH